MLLSIWNKKAKVSESVVLKETVKLSVVFGVGLIERFATLLLLSGGVLSNATFASKG